jgi:hypothetical protein
MNKQLRYLPGALAALILLAVPYAAQARTIYKYMGANGIVEYSTEKPKDRPIIAEMDSKTLADDQRNIVRSGVTSPGSQSLVASADARVKRQNEANANVQRAEQNLKEAQAALEAGREPLPGERTGTVSGFTRLNESYAARVGALERSVELARAQLDEAYRAAQY